MELRGKRSSPMCTASLWCSKNEDPPGFEIAYFENKGRGIITTIRRTQGEFLLEYAGELITQKEGEDREKKGSSGFRYFFRNVCIDATEETQRLGRLVNHGGKKERNATMHIVNKDRLCLFASRDIEVDTEILYDYGIHSLPWIKQKFLTQMLTQSLKIQTQMLTQSLKIQKPTSWIR